MRLKSQILNRIILIGLLALVFCLLPFTTGCNKTQPLTPEQVQALVQQVDTLTGQLTVYQEQVTSLASTMKKAGILDPNKEELIVHLNSQIDKVKAQVKDVSAAIAAGTYNPNDDTLMTILKVAQVANTATASFNPYATIIGLILTGIITVLGLFAKKKAAQVVATTAKLEEVVMGNEVFRKTTTPEAWSTFKEAQDTIQSESTKKEVAAITA